MPLSTLRRCYLCVDPPWSFPSRCSAAGAAENNLPSTTRLASIRCLSSLRHFSTAAMSTRCRSRFSCCVLFLLLPSLYPFSLFSYSFFFGSNLIWRSRFHTQPLFKGSNDRRGVVVRQASVRRVNQGIAATFDSRVPQHFASPSCSLPHFPFFLFNRIVGYLFSSVYCYQQY
jgi:hypothetical protein